MKRVMMALLVGVGILALVGVSQASGDLENGKRLFESPTLGGGTSGKTCVTCHPGGRSLSLRLFGNDNDSAEVRAEKRSRLAGMVNTCIKRPLAGKGIDPAGPEMADIIAYMKSLL
jgi:mono/diheme cytochrome c family protein